MVVGGSGCIGRKVIVDLLDAGMNVVSMSSVPEKAAEVQRQMSHYGDRFFAMASEGTIPERLQRIEDRYGSLDVTATLQGAPPEIGAPETITPERWSHIWSSHLNMNLWLFQHAVPFLRKSRAPRMILLACAEAKCGEGMDDLAYNAAKGGVIAMTYSEAKRLAPLGITVNAVAVGGIYNVSHSPDEATNTEAFKELEDMKRRIPMGRLATPQDVSAAICYLASEEAGFVTGEVLNVSGGLAIG